MREAIFIILLSLQFAVLLPALARHVQPDSFVQAGDDFMRAGRYQDAIVKYSKAIRLDKRNSKLYQMRADAKGQLRNFKGAIADLTRAISLNPNDPDAYGARAHAYESLRKNKQAMRDLNALLSLQPDVGPHLLWRADLAARLGYSNQVISDCDQAINRGLSRDQLAKLYGLRAAAYKKLGKKREYAQEQAKYDSLVFKSLVGSTPDYSRKKHSAQ